MTCLVFVYYLLVGSQNILREVSLEPSWSFIAGGTYEGRLL